MLSRGVKDKEDGYISLKLVYLKDVEGLLLSDLSIIYLISEEEEAIEVVKVFIKVEVFIENGIFVALEKKSRRDVLESKGQNVDDL